MILGQDRLILIPGVVGAHEVWHVAVLIGLGLHWKFVFQFAHGPPHAPSRALRVQFAANGLRSCSQVQNDERREAVTNG